ncbi:hypothetical protein CKO31_17265 [Thiohalocapsa halophila]|uniref:Class I SAM-dependent methyltransferase n=1 Tax=Thiohalocapsa halophila TaxID=69359 RepID=A0ABS1CL91_9GAMM|nr:hypothetical protein [Thiohalocapsa halophila]MBK1632458.1 hypothetical protein [Thiohalocapsa halophila]
MLKNEAMWLGRQLAHIPPNQLSPAINLGSGSARFRAAKQPQIGEHLLSPLAERGVDVVHSDLRQEAGVDIAGDIYAETTQERLRQVNAKALFCFNILEHLQDRQGFISVCMSLLSDNGIIGVSVPYSFPFHADPIDTMFRPSPTELAALFPGCTVIAQEVVECESFGDQLLASPSKAGAWLLKLIVPYSGTTHWRSAVDRARWLWRPYTVTCMILRTRK